MSADIEAMARWRDSPGDFIREVLCVEPDSWQLEVCEAVRTHNRVCLKASKGPGKSALLAMLAWWFLCTRLHPKVVATSITQDNLRDGLWSEMARWQNGSPLLLRLFTWSAERIVSNDSPETWFMSARTWAKGADKSQQANTLAGIHADNVMFLVDEAGDIPDAVIAAADAGLANANPAEGREALLLIAGNPTRLSGPLYRACTTERPLWYVKEISGDPDDPNRAPRVSVQWAREQIQKYGRENPWVLVNVFGQFPPGQSNALLAVEDVSEATRRTLSDAEYVHEPKVLGVDVARFGDDRSVICLRQGRACFRLSTFRNLDTMQLVSQVAMAIEKHQPAAVFVDVTGVGAGVVDRLQQLGHNVIGIANSSRASSSKYLNKRIEMWDVMAAWVKAGGCLPDDAELISELTAPTYFFARDQRMQLESKDDLKARGLPSPDKADALALTFALPVAHAALRGHQGVTVRHDYDPMDAAHG